MHTVHTIPQIQTKNPPLVYRPVTYFAPISFPSLLFFGAQAVYFWVKKLPLIKRHNS